MVLSTPPNKFTANDFSEPPAPEPKKKPDPEPGWDANGSPTDEVPDLSEPS